MPVKTLMKKIRRRSSRLQHGDRPSPPLRLEQLQMQLPDATPQDCRLIAAVESLTMTSPERILALINAVRYLVQNKIDGDLVECGVWRGGSMVAAAKTLMVADDVQRRLWLYDTFEGMSDPTDHDVDFKGQEAQHLLDQQDRLQADSIWCCSPLQQVRESMLATGYRTDRVEFVVGKVEDTLPITRPDKIALLRLDTDWYESTKCELEMLFPRIVDGGVLIVDDYGHWEGCRRAVDEYISQKDISIFLNRIDYTGRLGIVNRR